MPPKGGNPSTIETALRFPEKIHFEVVHAGSRRDVFGQDYKESNVMQRMRK